MADLMVSVVQAMSRQVQALTKVVGKKEEQLSALRQHQSHMTATIEQLQGEVERNGAATAAQKAAKTYAADLQVKVSLRPLPCDMAPGSTLHFTQWLLFPGHSACIGLAVCQQPE